MQIARTRNMQFDQVIYIYCAISASSSIATGKMQFEQAVNKFWLVLENVTIFSLGGVIPTDKFDSE